MQPIEQEYRRLRSAGWPARNAYRAAQVNVRFRELERAGRVRLDVVVDEEPYDDSYIDEGDVSEEQIKRERRELWKRIEAEGVWGIITYASVEDGPEEEVEAVWGFIGDDWRDSGYDTDLKEAAIDVATLRRCSGTVPACV